MTKAKTKEIWMPGKERPAASRLVIQKPLPTEPHHRNLARNYELHVEGLPEDFHLKGVRLSGRNGTGSDLNRDRRRTRQLGASVAIILSKNSASV